LLARTITNSQGKRRWLKDVHIFKDDGAFGACPLALLYRRNQPSWIGLQELARFRLAERVCFAILVFDALGFERNPNAL
jgi:hypothetical protein